MGEKGAQSRKRLQDWVASKEGQKQLEKALNQAKSTRDQLREARRIDPKTLHEPVTL